MFKKYCSVIGTFVNSRIFSSKFFGRLLAPQVFMGVLLLGSGAISQANSDPAISVDEAVSSAIIASLHAARPELDYTDVKATPMEGIYAVQVVGGPVLYVSKNGQYFFDGEMYQVQPNRFVNLSQLAMNGVREKLLAGLEPKDMIIFSPKGQTKGVINVFTDVDCGYCRKLHKEVPDLNARGIEVRYLAFPRAGVGSPSYKKIVSAWCSKTPGETLTELKNGGAVESNECADNPVADQYRLGQQMGVNGTPAIVLADGSMVPGYRPAADLARILGIE
jgi:thiol:disulfide interchange protein DsbC